MARRPSGEDETVVFKAVLVGGTGELEVKSEFPSKQLLADPFEGVTGYGEMLTRPPYSLEQLVLLAEKHPIHGAALEQKAMDIVGQDVIYTALKDGADEHQRDDIKEWLESLPEQETLVEILHAAELDDQTVGWGAIEIARDLEGVVKRLYHVPGHTLRAHRDNLRLVQIRNGRQVWFKRWGLTEPDQKILFATGRKAPDGTGPDKFANELLIMRRTSRRSTWYGVPNYVSAIGDAALAIAARDYNIKFFTNAREPRLLFVLKGLAGKNLEAHMEELETALKVQHVDPHRNLLLGFENKNADVTVEKLTHVQNEMHFVKLMEMTERSILASHRMPPDRVGIITRGFLGGSVAANINRIYKDAVVASEQLRLKDRLNRFIKVEYARARDIKPEAIEWEIGFASVDLTDETMDTQNVTAKIKANAITLNEGRVLWGMPERDDMDVTLAEWLAAHGGQGLPASMADDTDARMAGLATTVEMVRARIEEFDEMVQDLLLGVEKEEASGDQRSG